MVSPAVHQNSQHMLSPTIYDQMFKKKINDQLHHNNIKTRWNPFSNTTSINPVRYNRCSQLIHNLAKGLLGVYTGY